MHLLDHDPGEFLLVITGGICLAHGETQGRTYRNHREVFESQHIDYVAAMFATTGIRNERPSADVGCPRSRCAHSVLCTVTYSRSAILQKRS
jgi:hypothetical protein